MFQLCIGDGLPAQVCCQCVHQINTSYSFKLQCETSDLTLRKLLVHKQIQSDIKVNTVWKLILMHAPISRSNPSSNHTSWEALVHYHIQTHWRSIQCHLFSVRYPWWEILYVVQNSTFIFVAYIILGIENGLDSMKQNLTEIPVLNNVAAKTFILDQNGCLMGIISWISS